MRQCGKMSTEDLCFLTLLIRLSAFRPNLFMPKWLLWDEFSLGTWRSLQPKPFASVRLYNEHCLAHNFGRYLILAKLQYPNMLEQGLAVSKWLSVREGSLLFLEQSTQIWSKYRSFWRNFSLHILRKNLTGSSPGTVCTEHV